MSPIDLDAVADILREAATTAIVPRFRTLAAHEIEEKSPGELVTIADREAEAIIAARLGGLLPGIPVVGEEAVAANPALVNAITEAPLAWLVDPLDGTANFTSGSSHWAVMAALIRAGETVTSWIHRPIDDLMHVAERGSGAWTNGRRLQLRSTGAADPATFLAYVLPRFLKEPEQTRMLPRFDRFAAITSGYACAGYEYPAIIDGLQDFALFQRLLPWDHAPGVLLLTEAGGVALHPDGAAYRPGTDRRGLLLASSQPVWASVRDEFYGTG